jgi:hypothetical protein
MKIKVITTLICALVALFSLPGCQTKREGAGGANGNKPESAAQGNSQSMSQAGGIAPSDETRTFRGEIGDQNRIEMKLVRAGERLTGSYVYEKVGTPINLSGTIDAKGKFTLTETDSSGKQTGVFKGEWKEPDSEAGAMLEGNWTKTDGSGELAFYLTEQHVNFSGGLKMVSKQLKEDNKKKHYTMFAEYPQLEGATNANVDKFNKEVSGFANSEVNEWKASAGRDPDEEDDNSTSDDDFNMRYDVTLANDDLTSVIFYVSVYEHGAAHPGSYSKVINYDLKNGRSLKLADLFQPGANYLKTISAYSINDLKKQSKRAGPDESLLDDQSIEEGAAAKEDNYGSWNITPKGLLITFDAYQVGPYAAGPQTVVIPYAALKEIIRPDGPLAPLSK